MIVSKNVLTVMTGTVFGQLIPILASPLLARLYSGEQFGVLALYISISSLFVLIACGRYELAIVLPVEDKKALNLVGLSLLLTACTAAASFLLMILSGGILSDWFKESSLKYHLLFVPVSVISMGVYQTMYNWALRAKNFKSLSRSRIVMSVCTVGVSIAFAYSHLIFPGLIAGFIAGQLAGALFICLDVLPRQPVAWKNIESSGMKAAALQYKDFPKVNTAHVLLDSFQNYGITFLLSFFFGNVVLGWYSFSYRILRAPFAFVGNAYAQVLYPEISDMKNKSIPFQTLVIQSLKRIVLIGLPFFLVLAFFAPVIFKIVFGQEWVNAGRLAQFMIPWLLLNLACSPISIVPNILNKQKESFLINLVGIISSFSVFLVAIHYYNSVWMPFLYFSLASAVYMCYFTYWIVKISDVKNG